VQELQETVSRRNPAPGGWGSGRLRRIASDRLRRAPSERTRRLRPVTSAASTQATSGSGLAFEEAPPLAVPTLIGGRYEARRVIGRGGMGLVYLAVDRHLGTEVALKIVTRTTRNSAERFRREGLIALGLEHPAIVRAIGGGTHLGRPYLVYELVQGSHTLCEVLPHADLDRRVELVLEAASGVAYAHEQGVIHRDVKLENVLVDLAGRVRVTDFGLASARCLPPITDEGKVIGTPASMSPEQVRGLPSSPASDVWGLGVLLYHALTLEAPFRSRSVADLAVEIVRARPERPRHIDPYVPRPLETVCLRALSKHAEDRYPDAGAFAEALEEALGGGGTLWERSMSWLQALSH
jgi:eukaryotic-like serine/threonine-protein kinase